MNPNQRLFLPRTAIVASTVCVVLTFGCASDSTSQGEAGGATNTTGNAPLNSDETGVTGEQAASTDAATNTSGGTASGTGTPSTGGAGNVSSATTVGGAEANGGATAVAVGGASGTTTTGATSGGNTGGTTAAGGTSSVTDSTNGGSGGAAQTACTRDTLQAAADSLAEALGAGDATRMALDPGATYVENAVASDFSAGVWQSAISIAFERDFLDVDTCETFSEIVVTEGTPLVLGVRLTLMGNAVSAVVALVTDQDDWAFDAANYAAVSSAEDWSVIPEAERDTRETLIAAGNAYFDLFNDKSVEVPWNTPCTRLEGGQFTTGDTCDVGVPDGITFADKHWVVDRDLGTAIGMERFGGANGLPDSHMFRCLQGKIRYVHTITVCDGSC